jgi:tetratricopeptide (TPR) repeat protein
MAPETEEPTSMSSRARLGAPLVLLALLPAAAASQHTHDVPMPRGFDEPMRLYEVGLGRFTRPITTGSREAQQFFDQGVQLLYAFAPDEAARSFREAWKRDPNCAMCYFGEAWAWGPYLNGDMAPDDAPRAYAAAQRAKQLAPGRTTPAERALIDAMAVRYVEKHDPVERERLDTAYAAAIGKVYAAHPEDLDAGTLYAEALMLIEPRRGRWDASRAEVQRIHQVLESVLARDISHPGACHLLIHGTESTNVPGKAERCADLLGNSIPGASHINHMPSHTYNRVGRWAEAVRANLQAWHSDLKAEVGEGFAIYPSHNLHMLLFSASFDGQGAIAIQAARDYAKISNGGVFYHVLALLRFGRFDEILELRAPPAQPLYRGLWDFGFGYAHLRKGNVDSARVYLDRVEQGAAHMGDSVNFRGHTAGSLLGVASGILRAELLRGEGRQAEAISLLERAVAMEDALRYDEPEPLNFTARHWLGAHLLESGRAPEAEAVYRQSLEDHPHNGWSLIGLAQALRAQSKTAEAEQAQQAFAAAWARSDTWIRSSRF